MTTEATFDAQYDALIVGARAAGAATAMLLARAGLRVLAVDRGREGSDTVSTHALMRPGVLQLRRWGLLDAIVASGTPAVRTATFHYGDEAVALPIKPRDGVDALYAPRRTVLDPILVDAARAAGADVAHGVTALELLRDGSGHVEGAVLADAGGARTRVRARIVIGADGMRSRIATLAGAPVERAGQHATAVVYGYWSGLELDGFHWYYRPGVSAGAIPTNDGQACFFVAMPPARFLETPRGRVEALYRAVVAQVAPELAGAFARASLVGRLHAFPGTPGFLRRAWGPGWALVGDAGYFKDPLTAHGITDALRDAELLSRAVARGTDAALAVYQATRDEASMGLFEATDRIASFAWDLESLKPLHQELAKRMNAEAELLRALDRVPAERSQVEMSLAG
jgi:flavin-dependent dehydrogenase